jgi:hypothetical protein
MDLYRPPENGGTGRSRWAAQRELSRINREAALRAQAAFLADDTAFMLAQRRMRAGARLVDEAYDNVASVNLRAAAAISQHPHLEEFARQMVADYQVGCVLLMEAYMGRRV